jgi:hypothetical protein
MKESLLSTYLEPTTDYMKKRNITISEGDRTILFDIDISPYIQSLKRLSKDAERLFYIKFNNMLHQTKNIVDPGIHINGHNDIKDIAQLLCWILFVQEYCF